MAKGSVRKKGKMIGGAIVVNRDILKLTNSNKFAIIAMCVGRGEPPPGPIHAPVT